MSYQDEKLMKSSIYMYPKIILHPLKVSKKGSSLSVYLSLVHAHSNTHIHNERGSEKTP